MVPKTGLFIYSKELECACKGEEGEAGMCCLASTWCDEGAGAATRRDPEAIEEAKEGQERHSTTWEFHLRCPRRRLPRWHLQQEREGDTLECMGSERELTSLH